MIDTNVILDYLVTREPFFDSAMEIIKLCAQEKIKGHIAFHTVPNIFFILRNSCSGQRRREMLQEICNMLTVTGASHEHVCQAIAREEFTDFEDCLQDECAKEIHADYIITRNTQDFRYSEIKAVTPEEFLQVISK